MSPPGEPQIDVLVPYRGALAAVGVFSLFLNLLVLTLPLYMLQVFDRVLGSQSVETLVMLTLAAGIALLTGAALEVVRAQVLLRVGTRLDAELSAEALRAGIAETVAGWGRGVQGVRDAAELRNFLTGPAVVALFDAPWVPAFVAVIFLLHPALGAVALVGAILLFALALLNELGTRRPLGAANAASAVAFARAEACVRNADVVRAMAMAPGALARWDRDNAETLRRLAVASNRGGWLGAAARLVRLLLQIAILGVAAYLVIHRQVTPGVMIAASILMARALAPVEQAIGGWRSCVPARAALDRLRAMLAVTRGGGATMPLPVPSGRLVVEALHFTPPGFSRPTLANVSFALDPGEVLGVIGPSAAGKSTLARLLVGAWPPAYGTVQLDDADVHAWDPDDRGRHIGYLPQDVQLFAGTVRENVGRLDPEADPEAVVRAARLAGVHRMILRLPQGYDTEIGDGGMALSGGQRQRIGLARALFGEPRLLVLDEPSAHLDGRGEEALLKAIAALKAAGATVVIVAHRPDVVMLADKLLILRHGACELFGPRPEILRRLARPAIRAGGLGSRLTVVPRAAAR